MARAMARQRRRAPKRSWLRLIGRVIEAGTIVVAFGLLLLWCSVPSTDALAMENPTTTAFIDLRREQAAHAGRTFKLEWQWRPISKISRYLRAAVIYSEDYNFYRHDGVDWGAIESALEANLDKGSLSIGGSTITQQLAKNLYLSPSRNPLRKVRELLIAYSLEDNLSKQRILELYLNVVEWGDGVFGAEAAARHWFGKSAQALSPAEAIRLAIALPNPFKRAPDQSFPNMTKRAVRLTRLLRMQGLIDEAQERATLDAVGATDVKTLPTKTKVAAPPPPGSPGASERPGASKSPGASEPPPGEAPGASEPPAPEGPVTAPD